MSGAAFMATFRQIEREEAVKERRWIEEMRQRFNPSFIHPDDGWVDRERNVVHPCYPQYGYMASVGSLIVLGRHDKWRVVRCTKVEVKPLGPMAYYHFEDVSND